MRERHAERGTGGVARACAVRRQALELERLGHASPIAPGARGGTGSGRRPRCATAVAGRQRDVADGEQGGGLAHPGAVARRALREDARLVGVVAGEDPREARERGHQRLEVAHRVGATRRLLVGA
ncbi:MAG TPA: hypothetical protein VF024_19005, partial [Solirubrobacteraceae bacterium]